MSHISSNRSRLGYFLKFRYWRNAIKLLQYQLQVKKRNRHFNTLSMFYYERLGSTTKHLEKKKYFKKRVANNLFYGLENEFAIDAYPIPKSNLGLRNYKFFTYPMRILYYAVALYFLHLSQELVQEYHARHKHIKAWYGGKLLFTSNQKDLILNYDSIWYKPHYKQFRNSVRKEIRGDIDHKIVIHIDIQNFYDELSISILLEFLKQYVKPSIQRELRFDAISQAQITAFFEFMANSKLGIPQSDNDIVSSYLGYLYLVFADLALDQEIQKNNGPLEHHQIIRYMDDVYISLAFTENTTQPEREIYINSLAARIADCLYGQFGLRLNTKTRFFWLNRPADVEELKRNLKRVSPGYEIADDDEKERPEVKLERILCQLEKLKNAPLDPSFDLHKDLEAEVLKDVYTPAVTQLMKKAENRARIKSLFTGFNFDLVIAQPKEILIVLLQDADADSAFQRFLLAKRDFTSREVHLILTYLCQTEFQSDTLVDLLQRSRYMNRIMENFKLGKVDSQDSGYYQLRANQVLKLAAMPNVIEQIRLRVLSERQKQYSLALNHLLNEIHAICFRLDPLKIDEKHYDATKAIEFLIARHVPHATCMKIRNLFDRRNKNPVSHADPIAWPVSETEYHDYRSHVGVCLGHIL